ncbi:glutathione S-transferase T2-like [Phragmites australis]|uniref:glutathione S-transferase T2-like n=1 Tax=Phragmites australis TaxID=29695 RepID=UPI002D77CFB2|nr:glutathione S-transferase T2-like [Phragmites australis]
MGTHDGSSDVLNPDLSQFGVSGNLVGNSEVGQFSLGSNEKGWNKVTSKKKKKVEPKTDRTKWTDKEDELFVSAWLNVSQDPVVGTDQSKETYWGRITKYFNTYRKPSMMTRSDKALINHMKLITDAVTKFTVHYRKVEQLNPSGTNERDKMARACTAYKAIEGKLFAYTYCWVMLADHPKWHAHESAKAQKLQDVMDAQCSQATCNNVLNDAASNASTELPRPIGRDQAKAARAHKSPSTSSLPTVSRGMYERHLANLTETKKVMVELKKEQIEVMRLQASVRVNDQDERIMKVDLDTVSGPLHEYYRKRQEDILARWKLVEDKL